MTDRMRVCTIWKTSTAKVIRKTPARNAGFLMPVCEWMLANFQSLSFPRYVAKIIFANLRDFIRSLMYPCKQCAKERNNSRAGPLFASFTENMTLPKSLSSRRNGNPYLLIPYPG